MRKHIGGTKPENENRISRRELLRGAGAAVAVGALHPIRGSAQPPVPSQPAETWDCIVLGAGIAGVTAARDLHRAGHRVLLLEGSNRIGGRMKSLRNFVNHPGFAAVAGQYPAEAGADFVHVGNKQRYPEFLAELESQGFHTKKFPKFIHNRMAFPLTWKCTKKNLIKALFFDLDLVATIGLLPGIKRYGDPSDMPVGQYVAREGFKRNGVHLARYALSSHTPGILYDPLIDLPILGPQDREARDTISTAGFRADQLPAQLVDELAEWKLMKRVGDSEQFAGFDALPGKIAAQITPPSRVETGQQVVRVERDGGEITVHTERDGDRQSFRALAAVCTFSVGMLDRRGDKLFGALLTADKRHVLKSVRIGPITKFCVEFKDSLWSRSGSMSMMSNPTGSARTWFSEFPTRREGPFVLSGLLMSRDHEIIHGLSDDEALTVFLDAIQKVHAPNDGPWRPEDVLVGDGSGASFAPNMHREDWENDPFALGGNSFIRYRETVSTQEVAGLRHRLRDARGTLPLFWAGEATATAFDSRYQPLSVHGGYISGVRVAEDVDRYLRLSREGFDSYYRESLGPKPEFEVIPIETVTLPLSPKLHDALEDYRTRQLATPSRTVAATQLIEAGLKLHTEEVRRYRERRLQGEPKLGYQVPRTPKPVSIELSTDLLADIDKVAGNHGMTREQAATALAQHALKKAEKKQKKKAARSCRP